MKVSKNARFITLLVLSICLALITVKFGQAADQDRDQDRLQDQQHDQDQDMDKDRDRDQDMDQDRDRDRVHQEDVSTSSSDVFDERQFQEQEQEMEWNQVQARLQDPDEFPGFVQERERELEQERAGLGEPQHDIFQHQDRTRLGADSLIVVQDLLEQGVSEEFVQIAQQLHNSFEITVKAEERIRTRSAFVRFFAGGDHASAEEIARQTEQNQERLTKLNQLWIGCDCDEQVRSGLREQIQNMEQEQLRLQKLAEQEIQMLSLWDWLFGWMF